MKDGKRLTLDEPPSDGLAESEYVVFGGKDIHFALDFSQAQSYSMPPGKWESESESRSPGTQPRASGEPLTNTVAFELYDSFPTLLLTSAAYRNTGNSPSQF